jgi:LPXTG-site transpeptidase (sortase) family protein
MAKKSTKHSAPKMPFSFKRHIGPPVLGVLIMGLMFGLLNWPWVKAQAEFYTKKPMPNVVVPSKKLSTTPSGPVIPSDLAEIRIPRLSVQSPIVFEPSFDETKVEAALQNGVVHYGTTAMPGEKGNTVILGHSSGQPWTAGNYKYIFTLLDKLQKDDQIIIDYKGVEYIYQVIDSQVVAPTNLGVLNQSSQQPIISLITCTPVGIDKNRLVVRATQIYPDPTTAKQPAVSTSTVTATQLPF